ncbi:MAG: ABC transporter substrate-binding protein [Dehalococcoidia bacterium]|nr:ABC transporter substrate-binding protein [Dehalococcoidia bacterium]
MKLQRPISLITLVLVAAALSTACGEEEATPQPTGQPTKATPEATGEPAEAQTPVPGVSDDRILLGTHLPLSGSAAAAYAPVGDGMRAYFDYINDTEGGVHGRKIELLIGDDHYNPPDTMEVVRKLVEQDKVFAIVAGLGDETHNAVWKYLEERGVPDMFIASGLRKWTEPVVKTRFLGIPDYQIEGQMLGEYVAKHHDGKKLGVLLENNEYGDDGMKGLLAGLEGSAVEIVTEERCEATVADVSAQTQRLKNSGAEVIVSLAGPLMSASLVQTARQLLSWDVPILVSGVDCSDIFIVLAGAENAEGVVSVVFGHQIYETDHPGIKQHIEIMEKYGHGVPSSNFSLFGATIAELTVEALKRAGPNLTRESFVEAAEGIRDFTCSVCLTPVNMSPTDHRPIEIEVYNRVENGKWVAFGEPVDFETTR